MSLILQTKKTASPSLFLTSFDPSDLPGGSIDPLGFERGYLFLADKLLPGMTNVASYPRYFSMLCAGSFLAEASLSDPPRVQYAKRLECVLRLERFWALANVLAEGANPDEELPTGGIRGVSYVRKKVDQIDSTGVSKLDANFDLLSRQTPYGVIGIYASVADGMRLIDRKTFHLTPDLGERLAKDFLKSSGAPKSLIRAVQSDESIGRNALAEWGLRGHITGELFKIEKDCIHEAVVRNPVRSRMLSVLEKVPFLDDAETEQSRFSRLVVPLERLPENQDLLEATKTILAYERCYQIASLGFERLLWLCKTLPSASIDPKTVQDEKVLQQVCELLPSAVSNFCKLLDQGETEAFRAGLDRLSDVRSFLEQSSNCCNSPEALVRELLERHGDIQRGKFDKGRRKMPWIEKDGNRISLTMTRVGGLKYEALQSDDISCHPYRVRTADAFIGATA